MELMRYLRIVGRHRWIALTVFVVTFGAIAVLTFSQHSYYESSTTYVVRPRLIESSDVIRAIDTLSRGVEINSTFAAIARSDQIEMKAEAHYPPGEKPEIDSISATVLTGTNIIEVSVTGPDPSEVQAMADAVGTETALFVDTLEDIYQLELLDVANTPRRPAGPNRMLTLAVGAIVAVTLSVGASVIAESFDVPPA